MAFMAVGLLANLGAKRMLTDFAIRIYAPYQQFHQTTPQIVPEAIGQLGKIKTLIS